MDESDTGEHQHGNETLGTPGKFKARLEGCAAEDSPSILKYYESR